MLAGVIVQKLSQSPWSLSPSSSVCSLALSGRFRYTTSPSFPRLLRSPRKALQCTGTKRWKHFSAHWFLRSR